MKRNRNVYLAGIIVILLLFVVYFYKSGTPPTALKKEPVVSSIPSYDDLDFQRFVRSRIEKRCPFYQPDGITYRACLSDWEESLVKEVIPELADEVHAYCDTFTKKYTEPYSLESTELFLKCSIYKLQ